VSFLLSKEAREVAKILVEYSTKVKAGDRVQIAADMPAYEMALEVYRLALMKGAYPWIKLDPPGRRYVFFKHASEDQLKHLPEHELYEIKHTDVYIAIRAPANVRELSGIDPARISTWLKTVEPISEWRVSKTRWVVFYYPTQALAQEADMSLSEFEEFVFSSCLLDWPKLAEEMKKVKQLLEKTDEVRILGEETDIRFSVKGRKAVVAAGEKNMPDGEVFTSVVEDSVEGEVYFDIPAIYAGNAIEGVKLRFESGAVTEAKAERNQRLLEKLLATDSGARRLGEFGIGLNYRITRPVKSILFDEKIGGTIHLAIGRGYEETLSKNKSAIHFDLIKDLRKEGEVYFDGELVMKQGRWLMLAAGPEP